MFCSKCGKKIPEGANFCPKCGSSLGKSVVSESNIQNLLGKFTVLGRKKEHLNIILSIAGALLWIFAYFLPYIKHDGPRTEVVYLADTSNAVFGSFMIIIAAVILVVLYLRKDIVFYVLVVLGVAINIILIRNIVLYFKEAGEFSALISMCSGYYIRNLGSILLMAGALVTLFSKKNKHNTGQ